MRQFKVRRITNREFSSAYLKRLGLHEAYLYDCAKPSHDKLPVPLYHLTQQLALPLALTPERGAGGIFSTLSDSLLFLRAYFDGELFDQAHFERMMQWNSLFFPNTIWIWLDALQDSTLDELVL